MLILLFAALCSAGVAYLFWQLKFSDRTTVNKLQKAAMGEAKASAINA